MRTDNGGGHIVINSVAFDWFTLTSYEQAFADYWAPAGHWPQIQRSANGRKGQYDGVTYYMDGGSLFVGEGVQAGAFHYMMCVSGAQAEHAKDIVKHSISEHYAKCTRADIQVTIPEPVGWGDKEQWRLFNRVKRAGLTPGWAESADPKYGALSTVYCGSRASDKFWRVYRKPAGDGVYLRAELQLQHDRARAFGTRWGTGEITPESTYRGYLQRWGDEELMALFMPILDGISGATPALIKKEPKTKRWLIDQVLPTFTRHVFDHDSDGEVLALFRDVIERAGGCDH